MNRIVFITGATSGIGKACAEKFAAAEITYYKRQKKRSFAGIKTIAGSQYKIEVLCAPFDVQDKKKFLMYRGFCR